VEDTVVMIFDLNYKSRPFHDLVDYAWELFLQHITINSIY